MPFGTLRIAKTLAGIKKNMKHIKKKFLFSYEEDDIKDELSKYQIFDSSKDDDFKKNKINRGKHGYIKLEDESYHGAFLQNVNGIKILLPVPDPSLIYFHNAQSSLRIIQDCKKELLKKVVLDAPKNENGISENGINEIYNYFGICSSFVIMLFTSIESFINQHIPEDYVYERKLKNKTELFNKTQIQEHIDFNTKLFTILDLATKSNYFNKESPTKQNLLNLKELRDNIVHTKPDDTFFKYESILKKSLTHDFNKSIESVAKFMNHYKPGYVQECECGLDF